MPRPARTLVPPLPSALPLWAFLLFLLLGALTRHRDALPPDLLLLAFLHAHRTPFLDRLALLLSQSASFKALLPLLLLVLLIPLGLTRAYLGRRAWAPWVLAIAGGAFWTEVAKWAFARERPHLFPSPIREAGYGFPSGHAEISLALVLSLYLLFSRVPQPRGNRFRPAFWVLALGLPGPFWWAFPASTSRSTTPRTSSGAGPLR